MVGSNHLTHRKDGTIAVLQRGTTWQKAHKQTKIESLPLQLKTMLTELTLSNDNNTILLSHL